MPWQQEMFLLRKSEPEISASKRTRKRSKDTYTSVGLRTAVDRRDAVSQGEKLVLT